VRKFKSVVMGFSVFYIILSVAAPAKSTLDARRTVKDPCDGAKFCETLLSLEGVDKDQKEFRAKALDRLRHCKSGLGLPSAPVSTQLNSPEVQKHFDDLAKAKRTAEEAQRAAEGGMVDENTNAPSVTPAKDNDDGTIYRIKADSECAKAIAFQSDREEESGKVGRETFTRGTYFNASRFVYKDPKKRQCSSYNGDGGPAPRPDRIMIKCGGRLLWSSKNFEKKGKTALKFLNRSCVPFLDARILEAKNGCFGNGIPFRSWVNDVVVGTEVPTILKEEEGNPTAASRQQSPVQKNDGVE
jgi:hypothetical protein